MIFSIITSNVIHHLKLYCSTVTISAPPTGVAGSSASSPARPLVTSTGAASRIMHPPEDISLEELRARLARYRRTTPVNTPAVSTATSTPAPAPAPTPTAIAQPQPSLQQAIVEVAYYIERVRFTISSQISDRQPTICIYI